MILIGSRALSLRIPLKRKPQDFDFICTRNEFDLWLGKNMSKLNVSKVYSLPEFHKMIVESKTEGCNCEFEIIQPGSSNELLVELLKNDPQTIDSGNFGLIPSLDLLFTIKASHRYKNTRPDFFWKTVNDYHIMKSLGAQIQDSYKEFYNLRKQESYGNQKFPKLNVDKKDFFVNDNQLQYTYEHDDIHKAIALQDRPAYLYYNKEGSEVLSDKKRFFECSEQIRINGCIEEACVLAIERSLVPHPGIMSPKQAWHYALMKMCFGIVSGFFRDYCYDHMYKILKQYPENYFDRFNVAVENGLVRPFQGGDLYAKGT